MHDHDPELQDTAERLRAARPTLTPAASHRVRARLDPGARRAGPLRRSTAVVAACLAAGLALSGGGAALAIDGFASGSEAVIAQYPTTPTTGTGAPGATTTTAVPGDAPSLSPEPTGPEGDVEPTVGSGPSTDAPAAQPGRQTAAVGSDDSLPFTGFAALPVLAAGIALLITGAVLRRRV